MYFQGYARGHIITDKYTDRQTDRQTDTVITILRSPIWRGVMFILL